VKQYLIFAQLFIGWAFLFASCVSSTEERRRETRFDSLGEFIRDSVNKDYIVKDTNSVLFVHDDECTECLEAYVDSGQIYIPEYVALQIRENSEARRSKGYNKIWYGRDLFVTGKNYVNIHLFHQEWYGEDTLNFGSNYKFFGRVIGVSGHGLIFRLDSFKLNK